MRRAARCTLGIVVCVMVWVLPAHADDVADAADAVLQAYRASDEVALRERANQAAPDPFLVIDALLVRYAAGRLTDAAEGGASLEAARAYANAIPREEQAKSLRSLVDGWAALDHEDLALATRLADAWLRIRTARLRNDWPEMVRILATMEADLAGGLDGVGLVGLHREAARAYSNLDQPRPALDHARAAAEMAERLAWYERATTLWHATARFASHHGEYEAAREAATRGLAAHTRSGSDDPRAILRHDLAIATYRSGQLREAVPLAEAARQAALDVADLHTAARVLNTLTNIHLALGEVESALDFGARAIAEAKALGDRDAWLKTTVNLAGAYARGGRYPESIAACEEVMASPEAQADARLFAAAAGNLAGTYFRLGKVSEAIHHLETAHERARAAGLDALALDLERGLAAVLTQTERVAQTPEVLERILAWYTRTGNRPGRARVLSSLAAAYARLGREDEAVEKLAEALAAYQELGDRIGAARTHRNLALMHEERDRWSDARREHRSALDLYRALGLRNQDTALCLMGCAKFHIYAGEPEAALPFLEEATEIYFDLLHGLGDEDALELAAAVRPIGDWGIAVANHVRSHHPERRAEAAAIAYRHLESTRALLLGQALANAESLWGASLPPEMRREVRESREIVEAARRRLIAVASEGGDTAALVAAKEGLDDAWRERKAGIARIQRTARRAAQIAYPEVTSLEELQRGLDADTVVVLYRLLKYGFALVVTREDAALVKLGKSEAIRRAVLAYLRVLSTPDLPDERLAADLHARLVAPLERRIGHASRVVISPDGVLAYLPFGALLDAKSDPPERLIERFTLSLVPSATVLSLLRSEATPTRGDHVLAVGDPLPPTDTRGAGGLPDRLPQSGVEATSIAALFPPERRTLLVREEATTRGVAEAVAVAVDGRRFAALHFACHAVIDPRRPRRSGLVLSGAEMLDVDAILGLRIPADLAVLSACETARGKLAGGEGVMGFVRAFFHAGVPRVIVSSWPISDASTQPLMQAFYEGVVEAKLAPAEALRRAQRACLERGGPSAHPHHWAAFTLWGLDP